MATYSIPQQVLDILNTASQSNHRLALLTCGLPGSGKSTLSRSITSLFPNFTRFSIDATLLSLHGRYGIDYPPDKLGEYQDEAEEVIKRELKTLLGRGERDVVLDMSFWSKEGRGEYRRLIEKWGEGRYKVVVVVFRIAEEKLWERIEGRREKNNVEGNGEGDLVTREMLRGYIEGFEWPEGEGEVVVNVE